MRTLLALIALSPLAVLGRLQAHQQQTLRTDTWAGMLKSVYTGGTCSAAGGVCIDTTKVRCNVKETTGQCPGNSKVLCCPPGAGFAAPKCKGPHQGLCMHSGSECSGGFVAGACPGPSDIKCCKNAARPTSFTSTILGWWNSLTSGFSGSPEQETDDTEDDPVSSTTPSTTTTSSDTYPNKASTRTCAQSRRLTQVCYEMGGSGRETDDNVPTCARSAHGHRAISSSVGWVCKENSASPKAGWTIAAPARMSRAEILNRAVVWVNHGIRYSQLRTHKESTSGNTEMGYRTDCSGFVSMSWKLGIAPATSYLGGRDFTMFDRIDCSTLLPGDAMVTSTSGHTFLFREWVNKGAGTFKSWEEAGHSKGTVELTRSFQKNMAGPFNKDTAHSIQSSAKPYLCIRRKNIGG